MVNLKKLNNLSPEDKLKRLRGLERSHKKELISIEKLIIDSVREIKTGKVAEEITPEPKTVDISALFTEDRGGISERVERDEEAKTIAGLKPGYSPILQEYADYYNLKKIFPYAAAGSLSQEQIEVVDQIGERLENFTYKSATQQAVNLVVASRAALHKLRKYAGLE